jgi:hypothetical protein
VYWLARGGRGDGIRRGAWRHEKIQMTGPGRPRSCRPGDGLLLNQGERWRPPSMRMFKTCSFRMIAFLGVIWTVVPAQAELILHDAKHSSLANEKQALRDVKLYLKLVAQRSENPAAFDHRRPFYGKLITDRSFFESWLDRWQSHPARFEHWHPCLSRFLDGGARSRGSDEPPPPLIPPADLKPDFPPEPPPPPPAPPDGPHPTPFTVVPEPGSFFVFLAGLGFSLFVQKGRRLSCR